MTSTDDTDPGTPDALQTLRDVRAAVRVALVRLDAICAQLDRIEANQASLSRRVSALEDMAAQ